MKITTALAIAAACAMGAPCAQAQSQGQPGIMSLGCIGGAIAGGLLGNQVGGGTGKTVATAAGSLMGCGAGQAIQGQDQRQVQGRGANGGYAERNGQRSNVSAPSSAPRCFAQWHGQAQATSGLSPQGSLALSKSESILSESSKRLAAVNSQYAQAFDELQRSRAEASNPQSAMLMGGSELGGRVRQAEQRERQVAAERADAERRHLADVARTLDVCEYSAARGEDVGGFARLEAMMAQPMSQELTYSGRGDGRSLTLPTAGDYRGDARPVGTRLP